MVCPPGTNISYTQGGGQTFYIVGGVGHDDVDVDKEMYVSEANSLLSEANSQQSKHSCERREQALRRS